MTAKTKSERFRRLISHGYFAPELPPCFVSEDLAKYRRSIWAALQAIPPRRNGGPSAIRTYTSEPSSFYFPRFGRDDRKHGVINPISYLAVAHTISEHFVTLRKVAKKSGLSASPLVFDWTGQRALFRPSIDLRDDFRVDLASRMEHFSVADIRAFFHSIYTHAIPWAIYGKAWAKQNRSSTHFGNLLDLYCRNAQDGQTIGLPVGPDTSRLIAEVVASAIDAALRDRITVTNQTASRYVDDYTIGSVDGANGEALIAALRQAAASYELELNSDKSAVFPTSVRFSSGWKQAVRDYIPTDDLSFSSFQRFFYEVGRVCGEQPDINAEKFAFQNARSAFVLAAEWDRIQGQLINAYRRNSSLVSFLVEILILREVANGDVNRASLKSFLESRLPALASENRTGEIIWLLFLALRLQVELPAKRIEALFKIENSMVALLVNLAASRNVVSGNVDYSTWSAFLNDDALQGPMWLYAYESVRQGVNPVGNSDFVENNPFFSPLLNKKISFLAIDEGFTSVASVLRSRRGENSRLQRLRLDFLSDFEFETVEFDDDFDDLDDQDVDIY